MNPDRRALAAEPHDRAAAQDAAAAIEAELTSVEVDAEPELTTSLVPVGAGPLLAVRAGEG